MPGLFDLGNEDQHRLHQTNRGPEDRHEWSQEEDNCLHRRALPGQLVHIPSFNMIMLAEIGNIFGPRGSQLTEIVLSTAQKNVHCRVQSLFDSLGDEKNGKTIGLGGDGRYFNKEAAQKIIKLAAANGIKKAWPLSFDPLQNSFSEEGGPTPACQTCSL